MHMFRAVARLDVVTFNNDAVLDQINQVAPQNSHSSVAWDTISSIIDIFSMAVRLTSQSAVLISVVNDQPDGPLLAFLSCLPAFSRFLTQGSRFVSPSGGELLSFTTRLCSKSCHDSLGRDCQR